MNPYPVIFVPGITASELRDEYALEFDRVWGVMGKDYGRVAMHPENLRWEAREPARVVSDRLFLLVYRELVEELRYNLTPKGDQPTPVFGFPYDWRQPLEVTAGQFAVFVEEVVERTKLLGHYRAKGYADAPKVNLVGHSMGGLVIVEYLARHAGKGRVHKIATLGTPFLGSHEAVLKVATGTANLGTDRSSSREREVARVTPALYHLLPSYDGAVVAEGGLPTDLFRRETWQPGVLKSLEEYVRMYGVAEGRRDERAIAVFDQMLQAARDHRTRVETLKLPAAGLSDEAWLAVIGVGEETRFRLRVLSRAGNPHFDLASKSAETGEMFRGNTWSKDNFRGQVSTGDGTVPYLGAKPPFLATSRLVCVCDDDFGYWELKDRVLEGVGAGLHATLPLMNLAQRLVVRHFKPDYRGEVWARVPPDLGDMVWSPPIKGLRAKEG